MTQPSAQVHPSLPVGMQRRGASVSLRCKMGPEDAVLTWQRKTFQGIKTVYSEAIRHHQDVAFRLSHSPTKELVSWVS